MERDRAERAGIETSVTGLAFPAVNINGPGSLVLFECAVLAGLHAFTFLALTANHDLRSLLLEGERNVDSRLSQAVVFLFDGGAGQLAELTSCTFFFRYLNFIPGAPS